MAVTLLTNQVAVDNISLVKIEAAVCLLYFFVLIVSLLHPDFNLKNKA